MSAITDVLIQFEADAINNYASVEKIYTSPFSMAY
jgi:hypothetical protein